MMRIVTGPPCAGKSTYVREHAEAGEIIVDFDSLAIALGAGEHHRFASHSNDPKWEGVRKAAFEAREAAIEVCKVYDSWVIYSFPDPDKLASFDAEVIELDPGIEVCLERAKERPEGTEDAIRKWYARYSKGGAMPQYKQFDMEATGSGTVEGYAATFDREPDSYGDVIAKGAFEKSLAKWRESGRKIPLLWAHKMDDLASFIGSIDPNDAREDEKGLHVRADFDSTPEAQRARELALDGRLAKFSFAFDVLDAGPVTLDGGVKANELRELEIYEVSLVTVPANMHAEVTDVKAGRRNSAADEQTIREAISALQSLLGELEAEEAEAEEPTEANPEGEEPKEANVDGLKLLDFIRNEMEGAHE